MKCQEHTVHSPHPGEGLTGNSAKSWESWKQVQHITFTIKS